MRFVFGFAAGASVALATMAWLSAAIDKGTTWPA